MNQIIARQHNFKKGLTLKRLLHYDSTLIDVALPNFFITKKDDEVKIDFSLDSLDSNSTIGSTLKPECVITGVKLSNFVHDFTYGHLCGSSDQKFMSVFPIMNDGFDTLSPDMIINTTGGVYHVIEFATYRADENGCRNSAMNKIGKYELACANRANDQDVVLSVIATHRNGVWSNLELEEEEANELVFRFRLAVSVFEEAKLMFPALEGADEDLSKLERELLSSLSLIEIDWDKTEASFPTFKRKMFEKFSQMSPDMTYLSSIINICINKAHQDLKDSSFFDMGLSQDERIRLNMNEAQKKVDDFKTEMQSRDFVRNIYEKKSTVQIPGWVTTEGPEGKSVSRLADLSVSGEHPMAGIWSKVVMSAGMGSISRMEDNPELELQQALGEGLDRPDERNKYHRVKIEMTSDERLYAASLGVNGMKFKDNPLIKECRVNSKRTFSLDHDLTNLESYLYLNDITNFTPESGLFCGLGEDFELRLRAQMIHQPGLGQNPNEMLSCHMDITRTPMGSWAQMVSLVGSELSASVKQHVKDNFFIIKRIKNSAVYLLIKPTSSKSHIFVSFAVEKMFLHSCVHNEGVFKHHYDCGDLLVTDFVSYKLSKLTNLCKCFSLYECMLSFWTEAYGSDSWDSVSFSSGSSVNSQDMRFMVKLSMLTLMEDKATTEELQTMLRYVVMEGFVSQPEIPKPHKMIGKIPRVIRSELQVFLVHRVLSSILQISSKPFLLKKRDGFITWANLFNPLSGLIIKDLQILISCCYNGYFKNKEEETEPSALSALYKKIIELEHLRPASDVFLGWDDPMTPEMHEFSVSYLKEICNHGKVLLKKVYGQNVLEQIDDQILKEMGHLTLERLATLKATSRFDENWYVYKDVKDKNYTRDKLIVKMSEFASTGKTHALQMFDECMQKVENRGAMHICLFKKQQHGGTREIYVMAPEERIVQSVVEGIAKSIGKFFASDTLCNPANKSKIPETHAIRAKRHCKESVWTCATSDDARKWNQGHFVTKFALMLCEFTHPKWWPVIIRGCSMFTRKFMLMNLRFVEILDGHREFSIEDEFVTTLYKAYHGEIQVPWIDKGRTYIQTTTGMMQGILHFTSSLLHTLHQEYIRSLTFKIFSMKVQPDMGSQIVCDMMQGSDDSSMLVSFPASEPRLLARCKVAAAICFRVKKLLGVYVAIYPSEKSTSNTDFVMEYNSEFFFHSQHVRPTIRWIAACCSLPEVETLVARQEEASNLMTAVTEGGGSFSLAAMIQQAQCTLHYQLMGMGTSDLFKEFIKAIRRWQDPGLGFFLFDNPYASGLGGFRFNLFKAITCTDLQKLYAFFLKKVKGSMTPEDGEITETCSVSPGGALILSSSLKWGSRKKFQNLRQRLHIPDDWIDQINKNPEILYRAPRTGQEIMLRIAEKVHSPGVVSSLSTGNAVAKVMASCVYFLSASIFEDTGRPEFNFLEDSKYSLLHKMAAYDGFTGFNDIEPEDILFLFPNVEELEMLDSIIYNKGKIELIPRVSRKEATQTRVVIFNDQKTMRVSPEKLVSDKWFATQKSKIGETMFRVEWDRLKKIVRWLRDDTESTLAASPLSNHIQIKNFFARFEGRTRTVRITGAPVKKRSGISKLAMVIRDNFSKNGHLQGVEDISGMSRSVASELAKHLLFCILQGPYTDNSKLVSVFQVLTKLPEIEIKPTDGKTKTNLIGIMQRYSNNDEQILEVIEEVGAGIVGGFVLAQKSEVRDGNVHYYGRGSWRGTIDGIQVQVNIDNKSGFSPQITEVHIYTKRGPWEICQGLRSWAEDMGVKNTSDFSDRAPRATRFWLTGFRMFGLNKPFGAPVIIQDRPMVDVRTFAYKQLKLKVRNSTVNLYIEAENKRHLHVLSYTSSDGDLSPSILKTGPAVDVMSSLLLFSKEPSHSWVSCSSLPIAYLDVILDIAEGVRVIKTIDAEKLSNIIKICTESSLRQKVGTLFSSVQINADLAKVDIDSLMDLMMEDIHSNVFEEMANELHDDIEGQFEFEQFDAADVELFGPAHYKETSNLIMVSHPLMDLFIDHLIVKMGRQSIRRVIEKGFTQTRFLDMSKKLYRSLKRDPNSIRVDDYEDDEVGVIDEDMLG
ncbi:RNA-dependent RNA polymerase [Ambe virus]|uniref:RNA-directed RNA polymerase L n=1 Tax=Ambe virus TaxID=1926500 RepID=A0A1S5SHT7_9VIRU|nr:RNA-dependent RNA polymerase [Ambe virus]API68872.1 RNA-dependent RNA polymerase [Ambe virus]